MIYTLLLGSAVLNGIAQILWKQGLSGFDFTGNFFTIVLSLLKNRYFLGGCFLYIISIIFWFFVLSKVPVSYAYPFLALSFIIVVVGGYFIGENISLLKILGVVFIIIGIVFISRS